eukprot:PhF_6_TR13206/c0_g1_i1/m.20868
MKRGRPSAEPSECNDCKYGTVFQFCPNTGVKHPMYSSSPPVCPPPRPHFFVPEDIVWAKLAGHPYWPAEVIEAPPAEVVETTENTANDGDSKNHISANVCVRLIHPPPRCTNPILQLHNKYIRYFDRLESSDVLTFAESKLDRVHHKVEEYEREFREAIIQANNVVRTVLCPDLLPTLVVRPVGIVHCLFRSHYMAPRQPNVLSEAHDAVITVRHGLENLCRDLKGFDKLWIVFQFNYAKGVHGDRPEPSGGHVGKEAGYKGMVVPPRDTQARGVFATRSPHRPNPIGLSCVSLVAVHGQRIHIRDHDLLHGTPILDIKPYLPYCDSHPTARAGWVDALEASGKAGDDHRWNQREYTVHRVTTQQKTSHE